MPEVALEVQESLSYTDFADRYLKTHQPVIIRSGVSHWPAVKKWSPSYLKATASGSTFRVLSKSDYGDNGSKRFGEAAKGVDLADVVEMMEMDDAPDMSYVRQAEHWAENSRLLADIDEIEYGKPLVRREDGKLWMGPRGTLAQLHWDPAHNLFAQIRGGKKWILVPPIESHLTYPNKFVLSTVAQDPFFRERLGSFAQKLERFASSRTSIEQAVDEMSETEQRALYRWLAEFNNCDVDVENPDPVRTPLFLGTTRHCGTLQAGDLLFIPYAWRHYVRSLSPSISLNWFFPPQGSLPADVEMTKTILEHFTVPT
jgi:ribosomal protein L16 Arg81 hydroxylase